MVDTSFVCGKCDLATTVDLDQDKYGTERDYRNRARLYGFVKLDMAFYGGDCPTCNRRRRVLNKINVLNLAKLEDVPIN